MSPRDVASPYGAPATAEPLPTVALGAREALAAAELPAPPLPGVAAMPATPATPAGMEASKARVPPISIAAAPSHSCEASPLSAACSSSDEETCESEADTARAGQLLGAGGGAQTKAPPPGMGARGRGLSLDLSALKSKGCDVSVDPLRGEVAEQAGFRSGPEHAASRAGVHPGGLPAELKLNLAGGLQSEEVRASLKLNLAALSEPGASAPAGARPVWEFDYSEITLGNRIGAGAFGEVYEALWRRSRIAVKRLLCQRLTDAARSQFMGEMELMSNLRHPNIVRFLGACLEPLQMSILFELCSTSLYEILHGGQAHKLGMEFAMGLTRQIALGIFYLHQCKQPVLHLDLKSANVLLDEHGVAKVCDFGLSHIKRETAVITSRMGSPQWTAPEILRGEPHDESADTYSFGILIFEIMSKQLPYKGIDTFQVGTGHSRPEPDHPARIRTLHPSPTLHLSSSPTLTPDLSPNPRSRSSWV